jgi:hypothetical protein
MDRLIGAPQALAMVKELAAIIHRAFRRSIRRRADQQALTVQQR